MRFPCFCFTFLVAVLFSSVAAAHADTITGFVLTSDIASGVIKIDTTTGVIEDIDLTANIVNSSDTFGDTSSYSNSYDTEIDETYTLPGIHAADEIQIYIYLPATTLVGYDGGTICSLANPCDISSPHPLISNVHAGSTYDEILGDGQLSITPEPSSLVLLATGALGIAGVMRGKLFRG